MLGLAGQRTVTRLIPLDLAMYIITPVTPLTIPLSIFWRPDASMSPSFQGPLPHMTGTSSSVALGMPSRQITSLHPRSLRASSTDVPTM